MTEGNEAVLVVEDDATLRGALTDTLRAAGLTTLAAADAAGALRLIAEAPVALVISDIQMPGMDGHRLLATIKAARPDLAVVLMTAYGTVAQAVAAMREGATDYLVKPFPAQALIEMACRLLMHRATPNEPVAAICTIIRRAQPNRTSQSTARRFRKTCSKPRCSATRRALSRVR